MTERIPEFKIVVVYDTFAIAAQARQLSERLAAELQLDGGIDCDFWKFELLGHPQLREQAGADAASANMVVIATGATTELPAQIASWIESWPQSREDFTALVALFEVRGEAADAPPVCDYLRHIASARGMDFFCKAGDWWQFDLEPLKQSRQPNHIFTSFDEPGPREHIGSGWGIND